LDVVTDGTKLSRDSILQYRYCMSVVISPPTNEVDPARQTVPGVGIPFHQIRELRALALNYIQHFIKYTTHRSPFPLLSFKSSLSLANRGLGATAILSTLNHQPPVLLLLAEPRSHHSESNPDSYHLVPLRVLCLIPGAQRRLAHTYFPVPVHAAGFSRLPTHEPSSAFPSSSPPVKRNLCQLPR